jgi:hypothetical protein
MSDTNEAPIPAYQVKLLTRAYKFRIMDVVKKPSKAGKPMLELECETVDNPPYQQPDGTTININGLEFKTWQSLDPKALFSFNRFQKGVGFPTISEADLPSVQPESYKGQVFWAIARSESQERVDEAGNKIINPINGKPLVVWNRRITEVLCDE